VSVPPPVVLVVDDNAGFLRVIREVLERGTPPFTVHTATTGAQTLAVLRREGRLASAPRPAFVVLDFHLPDTDAPALLAAMQAEPAYRELPVLVLSQADWADDAAAALAAGARVFAPKPSRIDALHTIVVGFWAAHAARD
jgi:CheY-like chemotaxis protein